MGVLHRDVKLENLLCDTSTRPPRVKLCDFGHAVHISDLGNDRHFYGTPGYAAPEVVAGPVWTHKADVWGANATNIRAAPGISCRAPPPSWHPANEAKLLARR